MKQTSADGSVASAHVRVGHRQAPNIKQPRQRMLPGLFYVWIEALLCTTTAPCDKPANGRCRTPERSDGGPEGPKAAGLSNVGHRQALNTKNPRGFADGGFLLPAKK